ncbi:hypothetical protein HRbin11_00569 [bacterium HR11]|nr:hypothetical protein HRbin11_00569 [bacterium HR11]
MTRIESTGAPSAPAETPASEEAQPSGAADEFEHVIGQKTEAEGASKKPSTEKDRKAADAPDTARGTDQGVTRRHEGRGREREGGGSQDKSGQKGTPAPDTPPPRHMPGDIVIPQVPLPVAPEAPAAPARSLSPEAAALIQGVVDRIVDAVQVRMYAGGATEVRMELDMGRLGPMTVELHRTPEGQLRIDFQATTVEAQQLLTDHVSDLTGRLEARGLALQEVTVRRPDQPEFRWEPPATPQREFQGGSERERRERSALEETAEDE